MHQQSDEQTKITHSDQFVIEEWKSLRAEIARKQNFIERLFISQIGISIAIYSVAFRSIDPNHSFLCLMPLCLMPVILSSMSHYLSLTHKFSSDRIAFYLKTEIEQKHKHLELHWETWLENSYFQEEPKSKNMNQVRSLDIWNFMYWANIGLSFGIWFIHYCFLQNKNILAINSDIIWLIIIIFVLLIYLFLIKKQLNEIKKIKNGKLVSRVED